MHYFYELGTFFSMLFFKECFLFLLNFDGLPAGTAVLLLVIPLLRLLMDVGRTRIFLCRLVLKTAFMWLSLWCNALSALIVSMHFLNFCKHFLSTFKLITLFTSSKKLIFFLFLKHNSLLHLLNLLLFVNFLF